MRREAYEFVISHSAPGRSELEAGVMTWLCQPGTWNHPGRPVQVTGG